MKYKYTLYAQDGSSKEIGEYKSQLKFNDSKKDGKDVKGLYSLLDCRTIEIIPSTYYPGTDETNEDVTYYGDEEGRFVEGAGTNRHMKALIDGRGNLWDVVGTVIREEKISERASKSQ